MKSIQRIAGPALLLATVLGSTGFAATDVYLVARPHIVTMPDGVQIPMWGYALDADGDLATDGGEAASSPGPRLVVPPGETILRVHLRNDLPVPTSLILPGQAAQLAPVSFVDGSGRSRVSSFTATVAPGSTAVYEWSSVRHGSYLYQSGTHPAVQVQMGLYGPMTKNFAAGQAYSAPITAYAGEALVVYSEIDPALHAAVVGGTYGTAAYPSTIDYSPRYFLVNGAPYSPGAADLPLPRNQYSMVRFFNAGLQSHTAMMLGLDGVLGSEDGNELPARRVSYSVFLPAGKTKDALVRPTRAGRYPVFDRSMALSNDNATGGGMLTYLAVP